MNPNNNAGPTPVRTGHTVLATPPPPTSVRTGHTVVAGTPVSNATPLNKGRTKWIVGFAIVFVLTAGGLGVRALYRLVDTPREEFRTIIEQVLIECGDRGSETSCGRAMGASSNSTGGEVEYARGALRMMRNAGGEIRRVEYGGYCSVQVSVIGSGKLTAKVELARGVQEVTFTFLYYKGQWRMNGMYAGRPAPEVCS